MRTSSLVDQLPRYASDNPEAMPSIRFHEGDLRDIIKILYTSLTIRSTNMEHRSPCYRVTCSQLKVDCCPYNRLIVIITSASARRISNKLGGAVKTMCNPPPSFQRQNFRPSLHASIYLTQGIQNDVSARLPNITSVFCDLDLWPYLRGRPFMPLHYFRVIWRLGASQGRWKWHHSIDRIRTFH